MQTRLAILWHMHQPYYRDMLTGNSSMPWVRFHGIHSYYDMVSMHEAYPDIHATMNFVPSLVKQLQEYVVEKKGDEFLNLTIVPANSLNETQREFLLRHFFSAPYHTMIAPYARYRSLHERLGQSPSTSDLTEEIRFFSEQDFRDIQVYYNLIWFGFKAKEKMPEISLMLQSGGGFSENDKTFVIESQNKILSDLLESISRLAKSSNVEICTTPFYHPILPLIIDNRIAKRVQPKSPLPEHLKGQIYAAYQVKNGLEFMENFTGARPCGMWPAEGSVAPEIIPIMADNNIKWIAADEGVLEKSGIGKANAAHLHPYIASLRGKHTSIFFRNRELSDRIGFVYSGMDAQTAANDFVERFRLISAHAPKKEPSVVTVILDGENPWEHYKNSGKDFLTALFEKIKKEEIKTTTFSEYIDNHQPAYYLEHLASGSWINSDFSIWIGKPQKNKGWDYIKQTLDSVENEISPREDMTEDQIKALNSFCAACGSDWFWWYDDDFASLFKVEFDRIFRMHLENTFKFLGKSVPLFLYNPIYYLQDQALAFVEPPAFINPKINGQSDSFFEWSNALRIDVHRFGGAMAHSGEIFETIYFGFNEHAFYLRFDPEDKTKKIHLNQGESIAISVFGNGTSFNMKLAESDEGLKLYADSTLEQKAEGQKPIFALDKILELECPFECFPHKGHEIFNLVISLNISDAERIRYANIRFKVPDKNYEQRMWSV